MSDVVIKVENLAKQYRLGVVGTGTLSHDVNRLWAKFRGKEDPYSILGETGDKVSRSGPQYVSALRNIDFEIKKGQVLGVIGKNGAGKSTLLKLLSRITSPSSGKICIQGRVGSLLEVGTGFHPELTGRENVYLNGTILGMRKREVDKRFDEIVSFSGVEKYIDTPVKRYSSGMTVRLGFAVAAHLEPEILIVDEVLAVGDAEFQTKCINKMQSIAKNEGRVILFVSHNLHSVRTLCNRGMLLENGTMSFLGDVDTAVSRYLESSTCNIDKPLSECHFDKEDVELTEISFLKDTLPIEGEIASEDEITISGKVRVYKRVFGFRFYVDLCDKYGELITRGFHDESDRTIAEILPGTYEVTVRIPRRTLLSGKYIIKVSGGIYNIKNCFSLQKEISVEYVGEKNMAYVNSKMQGLVDIDYHWSWK